ncbi:MAG: hypothetical protein KGK07_14780 [Chloroflexota bacterium]|nr:hypothetical protein [Chloroflexota bacterium]
MSNYRDVPVEAAKRIALEFDKAQVIVVTWDQAHQRQHVTTYGRSTFEAQEAAQGGNLVKRALGWPEQLCTDEPPRFVAMRELAEAADAWASETRVDMAPGTDESRLLTPGERQLGDAVAKYRSAVREAVRRSSRRGRKAP